jgi:2',3'-cyclic-nucleotide 2'-phosphodiesterase (5'-nucleotidase family)
MAARLSRKRQRAERTREPISPPAAASYNERIMYCLIRRGIVLAALCVLPVMPEVRTLTILHTNDLHSRLMPLENHHGGFAQLASVIRRERANCVDCILLNAGDVAQGTPVSTIFRGLPVFEIANMLGYDAATLGNHDFDYGWEQARHFLDVAKYPIVSSNLVGPKGSLFTPKPYVILKVNGLKVGVIGAMTEDLKILTTPQTLGDCRTVPLTETVRKYAHELRPQTDIVVVVAHVTPQEELALLKSEPEVAVTVTGHLHTALPQPLIQDGRLLVRERGYAEELGRLELKVDTEKKQAVAWEWKHILVDGSVPPATDVAEQVKRWEDEVSARVDRPLAESKREFKKPEVKSLIERAMREQTGADFSFMNLGGVRDIVPQGQLKERNIWNIMPFDNRVLVGTFKGSQLPAVVLGNRKVEPDKTYTLAVSDFTAANQSTNENLRTSGLEFPKDAGLLRDVLISWFHKQKVLE